MTRTEKIILGGVAAVCLVAVSLVGYLMWVCEFGGLH